MHRSDQHWNRVAKTSQARITDVAEEPSESSGRVVMVDRPSLGLLLTNRAETLLLFDERVGLDASDPVAPEPSVIFLVLTYSFTVAVSRHPFCK